VARCCPPQLKNITNSFTSVALSEACRGSQGVFHSLHLCLPILLMFKYSFKEGEYFGGYLGAQCVKGETDEALMRYCIILDH